MDTDRSPGVGPLTWVTLGLLAFSWLVLTGLMTWQWVRFPPNRMELLVGVMVDLFILGPSLMFGAAAWKSRGRPKVIAPALLGAALYAGLAGVIGAGVLVDDLADWPREVGCCIYLFGWPLGVVAVQSAYTPSQPLSPPDNTND